MKIFNAVSFAVCIASLTFAGQAYSSSEVCRLLESDSDGDGWGFEGGASCRISAETGVTPQMNHPRTGQSLNIERIFWLYDDFSGKTITECQGYIVDPGQARDICSTCVTPAASIAHNSNGSGVYTLRDNATNNKIAGSLLIANRMDEDSSDSELDNGTEGSTETDTDANTECAVEPDTDANTEETIDCPADATDSDADGDNSGVGNGDTGNEGTGNESTANPFEGIGEENTDGSADSGSDGASADNPDDSAVDTVDENSDAEGSNSGDSANQGSDDASENAAEDSAGDGTDNSGETTEEGTDGSSENDSVDSVEDTDADAGNGSDNNNQPDPVDGNTDNQNQPTPDSPTDAVEQSPVLTGTGPVRLSATFDWNVDNNGIYSGALAIDFFGERTATGVRFWEESAPGQTGFYTLCEIVPSSMGPAATPQFTGATANNADASACIDVDGDGFGWDGSASCIP